MRFIPTGFDERALLDIVAASWALDLARLEFVPEGFGGFHWSAATADGTRYFVTVDDLATKAWLGSDTETVRTGLRAAFDTATDLRVRAGLGFVVAPIRTAGGETVVSLSRRFTVALFPHVEGAAGRWSDELRAGDRSALLGMLAQLRRATSVVTARPPVHADVLPERGLIEASLRSIGQPWTGGPFSEPARRRLAAAADAVADWLTELDHLAAEAGPSTLVLTHGEPHPGNVMRTGDALQLIDWDTLGLAPPERDLWMFDDGDLGDEVRPAALAMYRLAWPLRDLAAYVRLFRSGHEETMDAAEAWVRLADMLRGPEQLMAERPPWRLSG